MTNPKDKCEAVIQKAEGIDVMGIILITVKGGMIQGVYKSNGEIFNDYEIIDYDIKGDEL